MSTSSIEYLESLNNVDLRARCIEYGLPNVPITDTSRKLLIKRLRTAMEGGDAKPSAKAKSRRETINVVTKVVEPEKEASPKKSRPVSSRRTIGSRSSTEPIEIEKTPIVELSVSSIPQPRRSGRMTPVPQPEPVIATGKRKATTIDEESEEDDDVEFVPLVVHQYDGPQVSRSSRSPSLSKSKVVTTSYQHVIAPDPIAEVPVYSPRETIIPVRHETTYQLPKPSIPTLERDSASYLSRASPSVQLPRTSLAGGDSSYTSHSSNTTTRRYTTSGFKPPTEYSIGSHGYRPQTEYTSSNLSYSKPQTREYIHSSENSEENEVDDDEVQMESPYLSDFARRLSRIKAAPLDASTSGSMRKESSQTREQRRYYTTSIGGRRGIAQNDSLGESFRYFWIAIDRQYGLRKYLALIAIVIVLIFVYIFFLQQN